MAGQKGRSGRKPTSAATKKLRGTDRSDRDRGAIDLPAGIPLPPDTLRADVKQEWLRLAPLLAECGLLTSADFVAWEMGFRVYSLWRDAVEQLSDIDPVQISENGGYYAHPLVWIEKSHSERVLKFCDRFGLTPSARNGLHPIQVDDQEDDPLEAALGNG